MQRNQRVSAVHVGLDIGTTHITMVVIDLSRERKIRHYARSNPRVDTGETYTYAQDPVQIEMIIRSLLALVDEPIGSICLTGQVHGILYYDAQGMAVSPLYTWLDRSALVSIDGMTSQQRMEQETGIHLPSGYGLLTHFAHRRLGKVPSHAVGFCGILEFITGKLVGTRSRHSDASCLASYGAFDPVSLSFDPGVLRTVLDSSMLPFLEPCTPLTLVGETPDGIPVAHAVGDNQAGFFGMVPDWECSAMVSIGTSGQVSVFSTDTACPDQMELRPFFGAGYLHVGATLTAGKTYEVIQRFFASILASAGVSVDNERIFAMMKSVAASDDGDEPLFLDPRFNGARHDPSVRGSLTHITLDNLTPGNLVRAAIQGIVEELYTFKEHAPEVFRPVNHIVATGAAVRKNHLFSQELERQFGIPLVVADIDDGAGVGAALIGAVSAGALSIDAARLWVKENLDMTMEETE